MSRLRLILWKYQRSLAVVYVLWLASVAAALWIYHTRVPASIDTGLTVAARSIYHAATFEAVDRARRDFDAGRSAKTKAERKVAFRRAIVRLEAFLDQHRSVQPDRLYTQAIVAAVEMLAEIHTAEKRHGRAARLLGDLADDIPNNYRLHWLTGKARQASGDLAGATSSMRRAFQLAINHAGVAKDLLDLLAEQNAFEDILWVAAAFGRGVESGRPSAELKVGVERGSIQRAMLNFAGVPVEHGSYSRSVTLFGLERGAACTLRAPDDLFDDWSSVGNLFVQARFENVYDGVRATELRYWTRDGAKHTLQLTDENCAVFHRPHSGVEAYVEVRSQIDSASVAQIELAYSCASQHLSRRAHETIARARANVEGVR